MSWKNLVIIFWIENFIMNRGIGETMKLEQKNALNKVMSFHNYPCDFPAITETHFIHTVPSLSHSPSLSLSLILPPSLSARVSIVYFKSLFDGSFWLCYWFNSSVNNARSWREGSSGSFSFPFAVSITLWLLWTCLTDLPVSYLTLFYFTYDFECRFTVNDQWKLIVLRDKFILD